MKTFTTILAGLLLAGSISFASDVEDKGSTTVDHSTNPITGTETTTKETKRKMKGPHGTKSAKIEETTKVKKDGSTTRDVEVKTENDKK